MPHPKTHRPLPPLVALFTANPTSLTALDLEGEIRAIVAELDAVGREEMLRFVCRSAVTPNTVQRALLVDRPSVVQFSAHGRGAHRGNQRRRPRRELVADAESRDPTGIILQGDHEAAVKVVSGEALGDLFARVGSVVRLVFLNACHSAEQAAAIGEHVDFVIGIDGAIADEAAKVFAVALYRALALGQSVQQAFDLGVNALMLEGLDADQDLPVLRARAGADAATTTLVAAPEADDGSAWDVFISYAQTDREQVRRLALELHRRHLRVFFDEWEVRAGDVVQRRLEQGVDGSRHGLMAVSSHTMTQPWVQEEYAALLDKAVLQGGRLIPVLIGEGDRTLPPFLRTRRWVDLRGNDSAMLRGGIEAIARALRGQPPGPPPRGA